MRELGQKQHKDVENSNSELNEIDVKASLGMQSKMPKEDVGYVHTIQNASGWGKAQLEQIGAAENSHCDLCGQELQNTGHSIWNCCKLEKARIEADPELAQIDPEDLHSDIKRGIAPAMGTQPESTFWGSELNGSRTEKLKKLLGYRNAPKECSEARNILVHAKTLGCNARQLISVFRGGFGQGETPNFPMDVEGKPDKNPELFSDGSVKNPANQLWALGGFGVWTKTPQEDEEESSPSTVFHQREADHGIARWGPLAGFSTSSTRNELAAAIMGLMFPRPVHIGSDSESFVNKANFLLRAARNWLVTYGSANHSVRNPMGKPWAMQTDGDLWQIFWGAVLTRGPGSCAFTWIKGHATDEDIAKGISNAVNKYGNCQADRTADDGVASHRPGLLALCRWMAIRHADYIKFIDRIQRFIVLPMQRKEKD